MGNISKYNYGLDSLDIGNYDYKNKKTNVSNYIDYMFIRSLIMFQYKNLPDTIPQEELEKLLQIKGYCVISKVDGELYALHGELSGTEKSAYGIPTKIMINNVGLNYNQELKLDDDCILFKNDYFGQGLLPLYARYCTQINENDITMILSNINGRLQTLISTCDDKAKLSAEIFLKKVIDGELGIMADSKLFDGINFSHITTKQNTTDLIEYQQYLKGSLYNEIGLTANFNMKRERLTSAEVENNTGNIYPLIDGMLLARQESIEKINKKYGTNIEIEFNSSWGLRYEDDRSENNENDTSELDPKNDKNVIDPNDPTETTETNETVETTETNETEETTETNETEETE